jgi:hypothetical protein
MTMMATPELTPPPDMTGNAREPPGAYMMLKVS